MDAHVERTTTAATVKCLALARLKGIRPKQMRQLYRSIVVPTTDFAASSWFSYDRLETTKHVNRMQRVQKLGARIILRAFQSVSTQVIEAEASLEPVAERLARKTARHVAGILSLPKDNPLQQSLIRINRRGTKYASPIQKIWGTYEKRYNPRGGPPQLTIRPWVLPPWRDWTDRCLIMEDYQAKAMLRRERASGATILYTDASVRNGVSGCAVLREDGNRGLQIVRKATVGWARSCSVLTAELQAIRLAAKHLRSSTRRIYNAIIATDSQEALRAIQGGNKTEKGREAVQGAMDALLQANRDGVKARLLWVPAHDNIPGNEQAHKAAQSTTEPGGKPTKDLSLRIREGRAVRDLVAADVQNKFDAERLSKGKGPWGKYTWNLDAALPGKHTLKLYGSLSSEQAAILVQARTSHTHLKSHLARIKVEESAICECELENETVEHVLLRCPR